MVRKAAFISIWAPCCFRWPFLLDEPVTLRGPSLRREERLIDQGLPRLWQRCLFLFPAQGAWTRSVEGWPFWNKKYGWYHFQCYHCLFHSEYVLTLASRYSTGVVWDDWVTGFLVFAFYRPYVDRYQTLERESAYKKKGSTHIASFEGRSDNIFNASFSNDIKPHWYLQVFHTHVQ